MAAKSDGARQYLKMCACGREFNGAPILGKVTNSYKVEKTLKKVLTSGIIKSQKRKEGRHHETVQISSKSILQKRNKRTKNVDRDNQGCKRKSQKLQRKHERRKSNALQNRPNI